MLHDKNKKRDDSYFHIKGVSDKHDIQFDYLNYKISFSSNTNKIEELLKAKEKLKSIEEVGTLEIANGSDKDELINLAMTIKNLLSFGLGEHIIFDRGTFEENESKKELNKEMVKYFNSGWQIIPANELNKFLQTSIPVWQSLNKEEQKRYFILFDYLNQSCKGFIEDRILRVAQAWESLTDFLKVKGDIPDVLMDLNNEIKTVYRTWKKSKESNKYDKNGELGNKIINAINQEKLLSKLENLAEQENLNLEEINLDFRALKNLRDKVAHTGMIEIDGSEAIKILEPAIKGLQIILLKKFNYNGKIHYHRNGFRTIEEISNFEKKKHRV